MVQELPCSTHVSKSTEASLQELTARLTEAKSWVHSDPVKGSASARAAVEIARKLNRTADQAQALLHLAECQHSLSAYSDIFDSAYEALRLYENLGDRAGQSQSVSVLGNVYLHLSDYPEAALLLDRSIELALEAGDTRGATITRCNLALLEAEMGNCAVAIRLAQENRRLNENSPDRLIQAAVLRSEGCAYCMSGYVLRRSGRIDEAMDHYAKALNLTARALDIFREIANTRSEIACLAVIAEAEEAAGHHAKATAAANAALEMAAPIGIRRACIPATVILGAVARSEGRYHKAIELLESALRMSDEEGARTSVIRVCSELAHTFELMGEREEARRYEARAHTLKRVAQEEAMRRRARNLEQRRRAEMADAEAARQAAMLRDVQTQLQHMSRLTTAGEMLSVITHEINQPLAAILNYSAACQNWLTGNDLDRERLRKALAATTEQTRRASDVLDRLRSFMSRREVSIVAVDVNSIIIDTVELLRPALRQAHVAVDMELHPALPLVAADSILLIQIVTNLIRNAIEVLGEVESTPRCITLRSTPAPGNRVEVVVTDTGPGIPPAMLMQIFQPFVTTKADGMGLGLAISRSIVESFGGTLRAANTLEGGASFTMVLDGNVAAVQAINRASAA